LAESLSIYRQLLDQNSFNQKALLGICEIYIKLQNWKGAAEYADKCLANDINDHQALAAKGWVAFHEKDLELAMKLIKKANDMYRDATYLYMLGRIYWEMGGTKTIILFYRML
jgi:tetratricopeptide (TPR) repeat protein